MAIHTFAIGKREGAPIPGNDGFKKDDRGDTVISKVNTRPLVEIADATGGTFTHVQGNLMDLNNVYQIIKGGVDNISISQGRRKVPLDGYQIPLIIAIVLLFIDLFISRTSYTLYGIVFYFLLSVPVSEAGILDFFLDKNSRNYIEKKFENGERETESNITDGERTAKEYDRLGHFYYRQEKYPEAIKSFEKSGNLYNLGNAHFLNGDSEKAITSYENHLKKISKR